MEPNDKRIPGKYHGTKSTSGFVIASITVLLAGLMLLFLMKDGKIPVPAFLAELFGTAGTSEQEDVRQSVIPDFSSEPSEDGELYYSFPMDAREMLASLEERDAYVREFRVINSYNGETDIQKYTLTVNGNRRRLESDFKTVLCDGTSTWTITETYRAKVSDTVFTPEYEIGITSLQDVKTAAERGSVTYSNRTYADKKLRIVAEDAESGILDEYIVSIETGIVIEERSYIAGEMYRAVITDAVDVFAADDLPEDYFEIPG